MLWFPFILPVHYVVYVMNDVIIFKENFVTHECIHEWVG